MMMVGIKIKQTDTARTKSGLAVGGGGSSGIGRVQSADCLLSCAKTACRLFLAALEQIIKRKDALVTEPSGRGKLVRW